MSVQNDKRQRVLDATLKLIMENGVQATSMSKVSKVSGVAVGTIYHHFSSKEAIITELYRHFKLEMIQSMNFDDMESYSPVEAFNKTILRLVDFSKKNPDALEFCETFALSPVIDSAVRQEVEASFYAFTKKFFAQLKSQDIMDDISEEMLIIYLNGTVFSMVRALNSGQIKWSDEEIKRYLKVVWSGLTKK